MNLIKINQQKIIDIDTGMTALYYKFVDDNGHIKSEQIMLEYSNFIREFYDHEAIELWDHLCNMAAKLPNAIDKV